LPGIICLLIALQWGGTKYPWSDGRIIALLVVFAVPNLLFSVVQIHNKDNATVPPRIISQRSMAFGSWYIFSVSPSLAWFPGGSLPKTPLVTLLFLMILTSSWLITWSSCHLLSSLHFTTFQSGSKQSKELRLFIPGL